MALSDKDRNYVNQIKMQLYKCSGYDSDEESQNRKDAWDYYFQRARGDETAGRSAVVSGDISAMVEANLASMVEAFSSDRIGEFTATDAEDETQAQLESDVVQYYLMEKNNGVLQFIQGIKDALLERNSVTKIFVEEKETTSTQRLRDVDPIAAEELKQRHDYVKYNKKDNSAVVRDTMTKREFKAEAVPLSNFLYLENWNKPSLQDIPICAERHITPRSDLIEMFPDMKKTINRLGKHTVDYKIDQLAKNPRRLNEYRDGVDKSQEPVEWYECYILADRDGDGISERRKVCVAGRALNVLLCDEPVNRVPYASGCIILNPHKWRGISLFDKLKQTQDLNTGLQRALMDNVNTTNKNKLVVDKKHVNIDDATDGRSGGVIRADTRGGTVPVDALVKALQIPDTSANILQNIQYQNSIRSELGGAALDLQTAQVQVGGDRMGSQGLDRAYSVAEQLAAFLTKTYAITAVRDAFLIAHAELREWYNEPVSIRKDGKWVSAVPSEWPERTNVIIKPGMSVGERQRKANVLRETLQMQVELAGSGMDEVLVNVNGFYNTLMDYLRIEGIANPQQHFIDPESDESKAAAEQKKAAAQQDTQLKTALMQQAIGMEQLRVALDKYKQDSDLQFKYYKQNKDVQVKEAEIAGKAIGDIVLEDYKAKQIGQTTEETSSDDIE